MFETKVRADPLSQKKCRKLYLCQVFTLIQFLLCMCFQTGLLISLVFLVMVTALKLLCQVFMLFFFAFVYYSGIVVFDFCIDNDLC